MNRASVQANAEKNQCGEKGDKGQVLKKQIKYKIPFLKQQKNPFIYFVQMLRDSSHNKTGAHCNAQDENQLTKKSEKSSLVDPVPSIWVRNKMKRAVLMVKGTRKAVSPTEIPFKRPAIMMPLKLLRFFYLINKIEKK